MKKSIEDNSKSNVKNNQFTSYLMAVATGVLIFGFAGVTEVEAAQTLHKTINVQYLPCG